MVILQRLDGKEFVLNAALIETIEATPDTVLTLTNGHRYVVKNSVDGVLAEIINYYRATAPGLRVVRETPRRDG